jgi:hypothetical protein
VLNFRSRAFLPEQMKNVEVVTSSKIIPLASLPKTTEQNITKKKRAVEHRK